MELHIDELEWIETNRKSSEESVIAQADETKTDMNPKINRIFEKIKREWLWCSTEKKTINI